MGEFQFFNMKFLHQKSLIAQFLSDFQVFDIKMMEKAFSIKKNLGWENWPKKGENPIFS